MSNDLGFIFKTITEKFKDLFSRVSQLEAEPKFVLGGGGGGAPADAAYLVLAYNAALTTERLFSVTGGASAVDSGANSTYVVTVHDAVTLGGANYVALSLAGQVLTLSKAQLDSDYINEAQAAGGDLGGTYPNPTVTWVNGLNKILLYSGATITQYANSDAGMAAAVAASVADDTIWLPPCTLANDYTVPTGVIVVGESMRDCVFSGLITLSDESKLENLSIIRTANDAGTIYGLYPPSGVDVGYVYRCKISVTQSGAGDGYGILHTGRGFLGVDENDPGLVGCVIYGSTADII